MKFIYKIQIISVIKFIFKLYSCAEQYVSFKNHNCKDPDIFFKHSKIIAIDKNIFQLYWQRIHLTRGKRTLLSNFIVQFLDTRNISGTHRVQQNENKTLPGDNARFSQDYNTFSPCVGLSSFHPSSHSIIDRPMKQSSVRRVVNHKYKGHCEKCK